MKCPSCGHENREGRKFYSKCGDPLQIFCPSCRAVNEPGEDYCGECGHSLTEQASKPTPEVSPPTPEPTSFADGRYQVKRFLGEGGKKKVYLANDTLLNRDVAFDLLKTEKLDEEARTRIKREAQAMGQLGDHPNILTIFELGEHEGQPYLVLPLMPGGDIEGLIRRLPGNRFAGRRKAGIQACAK